MKFRQFVVQNLQMILLSEKGAHDVLISARCEKVCMLLPQRGQGGTLKNHMLLIVLHLTRLSCVCMIALIHDMVLCMRIRGLEAAAGAGGGGRSGGPAA